MTQDEFFTVAEVSARYKISIPTIYRLKDRGELRFIKIGRSTRLRRSEVEAWASRLPTVQRTGR